MGHPLVAGGSRGADELRIQVTQVSRDPALWWVSLNNPTERRVRAVVLQARQLDGLAFGTRRLVLDAGSALDWWCDANGCTRQ